MIWHPQPCVTPTSASHIRSTGYFPVFGARTHEGSGPGSNALPSHEQVIFARVVLHHAPGVVSWHERDHGAANHFDPPAGNARGVALEERRNHLLSQHTIQVFADALVLF